MRWLVIERVNSLWHEFMGCDYPNVEALSDRELLLILEDTAAVVALSREEEEDE